MGRRGEKAEIETNKWGRLPSSGPEGVIIREGEY